MNVYFFWTAAVLIGITLLVHLILGAKRYVRPLLETDMEMTTKWISYFSWHGGALALAAIGLAFIMSALNPDRPDYAIAATIFAAGNACLAIFVGFRSGLPMKTFPIIPLFGFVATLGLVGLLP